jgi:hypothetical protein
LQDYEAVLKIVTGQPAALHGWQRVRNAMLGEKSINYNSSMNSGQTPPAAAAGPSHSSSSSSSSRNSRSCIAVQAVDIKFREFCQQPDLARILRQTPTVDLLLQNAENLGRCAQILQEYYSAVLGHPGGTQACGNSSVAALVGLMAWCQRVLPVMEVLGPNVSFANIDRASLHPLAIWSTSAKVLVELLHAQQRGGAFDGSLTKLQGAAQTLQSSGGRWIDLMMVLMLA